MAELPFNAFPSMRLEVPLAGLPTNSTCRNNSHSVFLDAMHHCFCNTSCFYYMKNVVHVCNEHWNKRNENHSEKRILFRGSKAHYPTEKCGFRRISNADQRMRILNNLLVIAAQMPEPLIAEYDKNDLYNIFADAEENDTDAEENDADAEENDTDAEENDADAEENDTDAEENDADAEENDADAEENDTDAEENDADAEENDADAEENDAIAMRATIVILAIIQHYADVLNNTLNEIDQTRNKTYIATPALDCTYDLRVAASFAIDNHGKGSQGTVRLLVLPTLRASKNPCYGAAIQLLDDTNMLLIPLEDICPFFATRPTNQTGCCLLVHENDLRNFHTLRMNPVPQFGQHIVNNTEEWNPPNLDNLNEKISSAIHSLVNGEGRHWDALQWNQYNMRINDDITAGHDFFHKKVTEEAETFISEETRYPPDDKDDMKKLMEKIAWFVGASVVV